MTGRSRSRHQLGTGLAFALVWFALVAPDDLGAFSVAAFLRLPVEALVLLAGVLVLGPRLAPAPRRLAGVLVGVALAVLTVVRLLDLGFRQGLGRPFDPVTDWSYADSAKDLLGDSVGPRASVLVMVAAVALVAGLFVLLPLSVLHLCRRVGGHRVMALRWLGALAALWIAGAATGAQLFPGTAISSSAAVGLASDHVARARAAAADRAVFSAAVHRDAMASTPGADLLTGLRGKDVLFVFVESYGRVAVQGASGIGDGSPSPVGRALESGTARLRAAGYASRSAWLTSPTFGGVSWLAHSTLQSGLWVDSQQRYDELVAGQRFTISDAFRRAGWRTVADIPSNREDWPPGRSFYHYDEVYDSRNVGYAGPRFGYATMPDQFTLSAFSRLELGPSHAPVMAEIDLVSSHVPWAPLPHLVDAGAVGDGSVYTAMRAAAPTRDEVWRSTDSVRAAYAQSIAYSLDSLVSFVRTAGDDNLVLVVLGDHQPSAVVSGPGASHDVPVTVVAHDPAVMARIAHWGWTDGLRPGAGAPVWRMDAFRDRFLTAYGPVARPAEAANAR